MAVKVNTYLIKVYADAIENEVKKFKDIPEKYSVLVYKELEDRVIAGTLTEERLNQLMSD